MSVDSKTQTEFKVSECEPKALEEALGSHYALQVAHQTMKERCQQLQLRLGKLEEENLQLRIKNSEKTVKGSKIDNECVSTAGVEQLQEKIKELTREKLQLIQINSMVSGENRKLWSRLSRLTQANQSLGSHLTKISDTLNQHDSNGRPSRPTEIDSQKLLTIRMSPSNESDTNMNKGTTLKSNPNSNLDTKEQSLEEISLKLINSFLQEKEDLEEQYAQMVEMQQGSTPFNIHDLGFAYLETDEEEDESVVTDVSQHFEKLQEMKDILSEQHQFLKNGVENLTKLKNGGGGMFNPSQQKSKQKMYPGESPNDDSADIEGLRNVYTIARFGESFNEELQQQLSEVVEPPQSNPSVDTTSLENETEDQDGNTNPKKEDRICPMCGKFYPKRIPFDDFQKHVLHHFTDDSDPVLDNFEVIT